MDRATLLTVQLPTSAPVPNPASGSSTWRMGVFVGGPADGEQGPTRGDRVTVVRDGIVHRYARLSYESDDGQTIRAWIYAGVVSQSAVLAL